MKPSELPQLGIITNPDKDMGALFARYDGLIARRNVLCVGYSEAEVEQLVEPYSPKRITCLTNWVEHSDANVKKYDLVIGDLCGTVDIADHSFDTILLLSVFEHLSDVPAAFRELERLVKPGGLIATLFGPAWSCAYGHHCYANPGDPNLNFVLWQMPAHIHLLCSSDEIGEWYAAKGYTKDQIKNVLHWFFETPVINRVFFDDYMRFMSAQFQIVASEIMYNHLPGAHLTRLRRQYPGHLDFSSYGGKFLLRAQD
jgi:SAM-dependent methyltransferase